MAQGNEENGWQKTFEKMRQNLVDTLAASSINEVGIAFLVKECISELELARQEDDKLKIMMATARTVGLMSVWKDVVEARELMQSEAAQAG